MLIGEYYSKIGAKKRVAIPKKIREELGENLILTRGYERSLVLVNLEMWQKIAKEIVDGSFINRNIRDSSRFLVGSAIELAPDEQGRIVLPRALHEHAQITSDEIIFVGLVNWVELWDRELWRKRVAYVTENSEQIASELTGQSND